MAGPSASCWAQAASAGDAAPDAAQPPTPAIHAECPSERGVLTKDLV
eukprot:SAG31_NODE_43156_length_268_cov_0.633136_1_plen_46_part_01